MNKITKIKIKKSLENVAISIIGISGLSLLSAYICKATGFFELADMLAVGAVIGVITAVVFGLIVWIFPEWYITGDKLK
jgi:hypothetical protein